MEANTSPKPYNPKFEARKANPLTVVSAQDDTEDQQPGGSDAEAAEGDPDNDNEDEEQEHAARDGGGREGAAGDQARPKTKTELQKLRESFQNTLHLCGHFYADRILQREMRMVSIACRPLRMSYSETLKLQGSQVQTCVTEFRFRSAGFLVF